MFWFFLINKIKQINHKPMRLKHNLDLSIFIVFSLCKNRINSHSLNMKPYLYQNDNTYLYIKYSEIYHFIVYYCIVYTNYSTQDTFYNQSIHFSSIQVFNIYHLILRFFILRLSFLISMHSTKQHKIYIFYNNGLLLFGIHFEMIFSFI
jgi:hypothetical protein